MNRILLLAATLAAAPVMMTAPAQATGKMSCDSGPQSGWKSQEQLKAKLIGEGWQIKKSKIDAGCYEVYGTTPEGDHVEAYFHPVSLEKLRVHRRGKVLYKKD